MGKGHGVSSHTHTQKQLDHYANQHNPNNGAYWANLNNHANQLNPNNERYDGPSGNGVVVKKGNATVVISRVGGDRH